MTEFPSQESFPKREPPSGDYDDGRVITGDEAAHVRAIAQEVRQGGNSTEANAPSEQSLKIKGDRLNEITAGLSDDEQLDLWRAAAYWLNSLESHRLGLEGIADAEMKVSTDAYDRLSPAARAIFMEYRDVLKGQSLQE